MGSSSSKAARGAARKFPTRAAGASMPHTAPSKPQTAPPPPPPPEKASGQDGFTSADFSRRLQQLGVVDPNPTFSPSSTASRNLSPESMVAPLGPLFPAARHNPTLSVIEARRRLEQQAADDFDAMGRGAPRQFIDAKTLVDAVELRDGGMDSGDIEQRLRLKPGLLRKLGPAGVLTNVK